ncbi:MAG: ABC transporter permease [Bdellovibrionales bacterium]
MLLNLIRYINLRQILSKPLRSFLLIAGITIGVGLFSSILLINKATLSAFKENVMNISGQADLMISAGKTGFSEEKIRIIEEISGIKNIVPLVEENTRLLIGNKSESLVILGVDLLRESAVRTYKVSNQEIMEDPLVFLNQPNSIIFSTILAQRLGLSLDSRVKIQTARGVKELVVRGLIEPEGAAKAYNGSIAIMDIDGARMLFAREDNIDRADIVLREKNSLEEIQQKLIGVLGPAYQVQAPQSINTDRLISVYQTILLLFGSLAFIIGLLLVANTTHIATVERRKEIGILRSIGATEKNILFIFLSESFLIGLVGSTLGSFLGFILAKSLVGQVTEALSAQSLMNVPVAVITYRPSDFLLAVFVGTIVSSAAALWPSYSASRLQPIEAVKNQVNMRSSKMAQHMSALMRSILSCFSFLRRSIVGRLAIDNIQRNFGRSIANIFALQLSLSLVITIAIINVSFQNSIFNWLDKILRADIVVSSAGALFSVQARPIHEELKLDLAAIPEVKENLASAPTAMRFLHFKYSDRTVAIKAFDDPGVESKYKMFDLPESEAVRIGERLFQSTERQVVVSNNFLSRFQKKIGESITLETPGGPLELSILASVKDFASNEGVLYLPRDLYKKYWNDHLVSAFYLKLKDSSQAIATRQLIDQKLGEAFHLQVVLNSEVKKGFKEGINNSFKYTKAIELAALICAALSMMNMMFISILERTREIGLMRAIGQTKMQTFSVFIYEAAIQGFLGVFFAIVTGFLCSFLWVNYLMSEILGWNIDFYFPIEIIPITFAIGILISVISTLVPAFQATQLSVRDGLSYE